MPTFVKAIFTLVRNVPWPVHSGHCPRSSTTYTSALPGSGWGAGCCVASGFTLNLTSFGPQADTAAATAAWSWAKAEDAAKRIRTRAAFMTVLHAVCEPTEVARCGDRQLILMIVSARFRNT